MARFNGGISGRLNTSTRDNASGIWSLPEIQLARSNNAWTDLFSGSALRLDFDETTLLDSRISFTRATNATFFNASGVLITAGSGVARLDHRLEGGVWVNKGLLIEEQRTNLVLRSEEFNDAYWGKENATITANQITAPNGTTTADKLSETTGNGFHRIYRNIISGTTNTNPYTWSVFAKAAERSQIVLVFFEGTTFSRSISYRANLSSGTVVSTGGNNGATLISSSIQDVGGGWYRCSVTGTLGGAQTTIWPQINTALDNGSQSYVGTTGSGIHIWGAQLEAGAFPTSYIKTTTASVTRNADVASMTGTNFTSWFNATEGTVYSLTDGQDPTNSNVFNSLFRWSISDNSNNERIQFAAFTETGVVKFSFAIYDNNVIQSTLNQDLGSWSTTNQYAGASAYKVDDFALSIDGATVLTSTAGTLPTVNRLYLGSNPTGSAFYLNGHIAKFYFWNTRKTNQVLQNLTE